MGAGEIFQGEGSGGEGGKRGSRGREVGVRGEGSGGWGPSCPPPLIFVKWLGHILNRLAIILIYHLSNNIFNL